MIPIKPYFWRRRRYKWYSTATTSDRRRKIAELIGTLLLLVLVHSAGMMYLEGLSAPDALWLTVTTMTTVGYGDFSAQTTAGRLMTIALMYLVGIFLLAQIAGEWIDFRIARKDRMRRGDWRWQMKDHILIINTPEANSEQYLRTLIEQIRRTPQLEDFPIEVLSPGFPSGLPETIARHGVVLHHGVPEGQTDLADVNAADAAFVVLMAISSSEYRSDSLTLDILDQLKSLNLKGHVIAECVQESNRARLIEHGANAVIRPVRAYPELLVRAMAAPGTEAIFEDLFQHEGSHTRRYDVEFSDRNWGEFAAALLIEGLGTPVGFLDDAGVIHTNPKPSVVASGCAVYVIVSHDAPPEPDRVKALAAG